MSSVTMPATAADTASSVGQGLSSAESVAAMGQAGADYGGAAASGALQGTTEAGLNGIGSIVPASAALDASLSGAGALASGGGGGLSIGRMGTPSSVLSGAGAPAGPGVLGSTTGGPLGAASSAAAPVSAPVSPTTSGIFDGSQIGGTNIVAGNTVAAPNDPAGLANAQLSSMSGADPTKGAPVTAPSSTPNLDAFTSNPGVETGWNLIKSNPNVALSTLGLGANLMLSNQQLRGESALKGAAGRMGAQAETLQSYLQTGTLPPGLKSGLTSAGAAAKATIRSRHAASGTSGSSAEAQELASVDAGLETQGANIAMSLFQQGMNEAQISAQLYQTILQGALVEDQQLGSAIGRFASSFAPTTTINLTGH